MRLTQARPTRPSPFRVTPTRRRVAQPTTKLSEERAQAVAEYLESKGVKADRLIVKGYGATVQPFSGNIENNRVVVIK